MLRLRRLSAVLLLLGFAACGATQRGGGEQGTPSRPVAQFPERARVTQVVEAGPPPALGPLLPRGELHVDRWEMQATPAPGDAPYEPEGPFEPLLDAAAAQRGVSITRSASLRCVAEEMARFYAANEALPTERLSRHLLAACGTNAIAVGRAGSRGELDPRATPEMLVREAGDSLRDALAPVLIDGAQVGLGFAREGANVSLMVVVAEPSIRFEAPEPPDAAGDVVVRGQLLGRADGILALVNQGPHGVARCRVSPTVGLPSFELRCPLAEGDDTAIAHVATFSLGRVLTRHVGTVLLRRSAETPAPPYAPQPVGEPAPITSPEAAPATFVERLNAVRAAAGLAPVELAPAQTRVEQTVAPHLLGALLQDQQDAQDTLALGLMAGWEVEGGTIRWADIVGHTVVGNRDVAWWLSDALEQPGSRYVLLRDDIRQVAIGATPVADPEALGLVVSTYAFFEDADFEAAATRFFDRVTEARTAAGLPPPRRLGGLERVWHEARTVSAGRSHANAAFQRALNAESQAQGRSLQGVMLETVDLDLGDLPEVVMARRELSLGVAVGFTRAPGAAWGQYVVFLVFPAS